VTRPPRRRAAPLFLAALAVAAFAAIAAAEPDVAAAPPAHEDAAPRGPGVDERLAEITRRVQNAIEYPPIAQSRGLAGETRVSFEIARDGRPLEIRTAESSGSTALDRAAERAVADAAPLPWVYGRITVPVEFAIRD
jgi:TonB family protein